MEQTKLLLISARGTADYTNALNVMYVIQMNVIPTTIEDTMYAYMVAKDWCEWIKNPGEPAENPLLYDVDDSLSSMFERYAEKFEEQLLISLVDIEACVDILNPNLITLYRGKNPVWSENTRLLYRSLRYTAQMFEDKGDDHLSKLLDEKQVPPMDKLSKCRVFE